MSEIVTALDRLDMDDLLLLADAVADVLNRYVGERDGGFPDRQEQIDRALRLAQRLDGRLDDLSIAITGRPFE